MGAIALIIFVHARTGSFAIAGLVSGAYTLSFALIGPLLGRQVDRRGPLPVLLPASGVCALALLGVVAIGENGAATLPLVAVSAAAGAATPPVSGVLRRTWPSVVDRDDLSTAYLIDSVLIEIVFICGPLLTGLLAAAIDPAAPLLFAAGLVVFGTAWFLLAAAVRALRPAGAEHHTRSGALASPTIRYLILTGIPIGSSFGALDVALPAFGASHGGSALGGLFAAALSTGSMLGAVLFGLAGGAPRQHARGLHRAGRRPAAARRAATAGADSRGPRPARPAGGELCGAARHPAQPHRRGLDAGGDRDRNLHLAAAGGDGRGQRRCGPGRTADRGGRLAGRGAARGGGPGGVLPGDLLRPAAAADRPGALGI
jgi:hypothetical protein